MKLYIIIFLTIFITSNEVIYSQELKENSKDSKTGMVYFIRGKGFSGSATSFSALIDKNRVCKLNNRRYSVHEITPGLHDFEAQFSGKKGKGKAEIIDITIEAGKTYYIQMVMQESLLINDVSPFEITRNSALRLVKDDKIKLDENCGD
ncbi:MAG: DUF2846 domain-containing protein [Flavobacteriaceae bacterium]|nr:DUF2846 domain-containing protein [Flavobacteriaceae bacterium]